LTEPTATSFFKLTAARRGHFQLESGHHSEVWFDLDALFGEPRRIEPFVNQLGESLRRYNVAAVCGPLLGGAFLAQLVAHALDVQFCFTERVLPRDTSGLFRARYVLPPGFRASVRDQPVAIVDDVMSAGSALGGTYTELQTHGATIVVAGALMVLGETGNAFFARRKVAVEAVVREHYSLWLPWDCPLCADGPPIENVAAPNN
jgi:orotate phosphoribosyltransferase